MPYLSRLKSIIVAVLLKCVLAYTAESFANCRKVLSTTGPEILARGLGPRGYASLHRYIASNACSGILTCLLALLRKGALFSPDHPPEGGCVDSLSSPTRLPDRTGARSRSMLVQHADICGQPAPHKARRRLYRHRLLCLVPTPSSCPPHL